MRILVVDDEIRLAQSIARGLAAEGFDTDVVHNGLDALWRAREVDYAAIVLDIMLPGKNGYEVCRKLRSDDYLRKPFSYVVLVARLRAMLRRGNGGTSSNNTITVGSISLNPGQLQATRDDHTVELTPREFAVIEFLARRSPDVVSKSALLNSVWGIDFDGDPNIVEVYVGYLRKKIGKTAIRTVRGAGYQLSVSG
jgi:two-component system OmpR family response regulator